MIDLDELGLLFRNRMISVPFEPVWVEFGILIPAVPLPEKSQKECGLRNSAISLKLVKKLDVFITFQVNLY